MARVSPPTPVTPSLEINIRCLLVEMIGGRCLTFYMLINDMSSLLSPDR